MTTTTATPARHVLSGIRPEPLASYLTGLGLIRVLAQQADPAATAVWQDGGLVIETTVVDLADWLTESYVPSLVLSPWNNGSGFGPKDKEPKRFLEAIQAHPSPRLAQFREAIPLARSVSDQARAEGWLTEDGKKGDKGKTVLALRNRSPEELLPWIDASVVLAGSELEPFFPPILGTGGNDGRLDFSTNFHQRLLDVLDETSAGRKRSLGCARDLLTGQQSERLTGAAVGQFDPGAAGGPGSSIFGAAESLVNPWAYVLLVEGALMFAASPARRNQFGAGRAAIPFWVSASPDGSASGADGEESRGELWIPVWRRAFTLPEIRQLFIEARASWQGRPARRAVDFYAATRTLGVARGIDEFVRYGLQRRNGLAFAAVPLDRVDVRTRMEVRLIAQVANWVSRARRAGTSTAVSEAIRRYERAELAYVRDGRSADLCGLLAAVTSLEQAIGRSSRARDEVSVRIPPDARRFLTGFAKVDSPELRIAVGLASCTTLAGEDPVRVPSRTMRQILLSIDPPAPKDRNRSGGRWRDSPLVPGYGSRPLPSVLADVLAWRCRTAADERSRRHFHGVPSFRSARPVPAADLHALARGDYDETKLDLLLRACLALDWSRVSDHDLTVLPSWAARPNEKARLFIPVPTLGLLHPLAAGLIVAGTDGDQPRLALRPDWANRLAAGQAEAVHKEAVIRLRQAGWDAVASTANTLRPERIAAALVPRCQDPVGVLDRFATRIKTRGDEFDQPSEELTDPVLPPDTAEPVDSQTPDIGEEDS